MECKSFVEEQIAQIKQTVGEAIAINALSGGVDSSTGAALLAEQGHDVVGVMAHFWAEPAGDGMRATPALSAPA